VEVACINFMIPKCSYVGMKDKMCEKGIQLCTSYGVKLGN
jgi:hypothetical protein